MRRRGYWLAPDDPAPDEPPPGRPRLDRTPSIALPTAVKVLSVGVMAEPDVGVVSHCVASVIALVSADVSDGNMAVSEDAARSEQLVAV